MSHPARFTPAIFDAVEPLLVNLALPVHDPFAGTGERLGELCDRLRLGFTGTEIEEPFIVDPRVKAGDSTDELTYPLHEHVVVTSPAYPTGMCDHFHAHDGSKRHTYRQGLAEITGEDGPLHPHNMGRWGSRHRRSPASEAEYFRIAANAIQHWPVDAIVNVRNVVAETYEVDVVGRWFELLEDAGYEIVRTIEVPTPGQRNGANRHLRADHELVLWTVRS